MLDNLQFTLPVISCIIRIAIFWWKKEGKHHFWSTNFDYKIEVTKT